MRVCSKREMSVRATIAILVTTTAWIPASLGTPANRTESTYQRAAPQESERPAPLTFRLEDHGSRPSAGLEESKESFDRAGNDDRPTVPRTIGGDAWEFEFSPYLWMPSLRSHASVGPLSMSRNVAFTELLKDLDVAGMARFEARKSRWGLYVEGLFIKLSDDVNLRLFERRARGISVNASFEQGELGVGGFYRFGDAGQYLDLLAGARYTYFHGDLSIGGLIDPSFTKHLLDPVFGARVHLALSDRWMLQLKGDIGGFGAGTKLTWGLTGLVGYRLSDSITVGLGYRYYNVQFESFDLNLQYHGPLIGLTFRF